jgi:TolB-like protein
VRILLAFALIISIALPADRTRIAVMSFTTKTGVEANIGETVTDLLSSSLVTLKKFEVLDRENLHKVLKEQALQNSGCTEQACAVKLGNILNVQRLVVGSISKLGQQYLVTVNFVDIERGKVEISESTTVGVSDLVPRIQRIVAKIGNQVPVAGRILSIDGKNTYTVNLGKDDGATKGIKVSVQRYSNAIVDPSTGDFLGRRVIELGQASVSAVDGGGSVCTIRATLGSGPFSVGDKVFWRDEKELLEEVKSDSTVRPSEQPPRNPVTNTESATPQIHPENSGSEYSRISQFSFQGGRIAFESPKWVEYQDGISQAIHSFHLFFLDSKYLYLVDKSRTNRDTNNFFQMRIPIKGGMAGSSYENPLNWVPAYVVKPEMGNSGYLPEVIDINPKNLEKPKGFVYPGGEWIYEDDWIFQIPAFSPGRYFRFKGVKKDNKYFYFEDTTRFDSKPDNFMLMRIPVRGGTCSWSFNLNTNWTPMALFKPQY